ncbi:MAG: hypothetical protein WC781_00740 [Candidatus Pacearchaeota archaeon]|jgi:hypothetical protein
MNKKSVLIVIILMLGIFITSFASADVFLSTQPLNTYNVGDTLSVVLGSDGGEGWASVNLLCNNQSKMLYFHYISDTSSANIDAPLTRDFLRTGMIGSCHLTVIFNGQEKDSFSFSISDSIDASVTFNGVTFLPGEEIIFNGVASKPNNGYVEGSAEIKFKGIGLETIVPIVDNEFSGNITIPENIAAGSYEVTLLVYEKDSLGGVTNKGEAKADTITIDQKPTILKLDVEKNVNPGKELSFKSILYDQTGMMISAIPVVYILTDLDDNEVFNKLANTDESISVNIEKNAPFGYWLLSADAEGITTSSQIYVEKNMEAVFEMLNGTLRIKNVGNVPYNKTIEIRIGNETKVKPIVIDPGRTIEFDLTAPNGEYDIGVSDGELSELFTGIPLTGGVISLDGSGRKVSLGFFNRNWLAWLFIIGVLGLFIFAASRKVVNKNTFLSSKDSSKYTPKEPDKKGGVVKVTPVGENKMPMIEPDSGIASHSLVIDGTKQNACLLALKLKNFQELKANNTADANEVLKKAIEEIKDAKGKVYKTDDFIIGIFAPIDTKTFENNLNAIKTGKVICNKLKDYNHKFKQRIEFGIGINTGDIVAKKDAGRLLFTPLGATLTAAKKIAEISSSEVLLSEETHKRVMSQVKTNMNPEKNGIKTFSVADIVDRGQNSKFIESFLQRNQEFKTLRDYRTGSQSNRPTPQFSNPNKLDNNKPALDKPAEDVSKPKFNLDDWTK